MCIKNNMGKKQNKNKIEIERGDFPMNLGNKKIFIMNGSGASGKDTVADIIKKYLPIMKYSSIDGVKEYAKMMGWRGTKTEKDRKFLSELKRILIEYNDFPCRDVSNVLEDFLQDFCPKQICIIDIREADEIDKIKEKFNDCHIITILVRTNRVEKIVSNEADKNVDDYNYDYILENYGTLEDLEESVVSLLKDLGLESDMTKV